MSPRILVCDIETMPAIIEKWDLYPSYTPIDMVLEPARILCFAAKWRDKSPIMFHAAWEDGDDQAYRAMIEAAWHLLDEADFLVGVNSDRFDLQHLNAAFGRLNMGAPSPYRSIDLQKVARRHFKRGEMSLKLDWYARSWLGDAKVKHDGIELWQRIRRGTDAEKAKSRRMMTKYNRHDVRLTEQLFERFLPWIGENFALYDSDADDETPRCTKCNSDSVQRRGYFPTRTCMYPRWRCNECGSWSRGRRMSYTNELRPV
jgi:hypothetical protein